MAPFPLTPLQVFFAKCAPSATVEAVTRVFGAYGEIEEVNLFRQWCAAPTAARANKEGARLRRAG